MEMIRRFFRTFKLSLGNTQQRRPCQVPYIYLKPRKNHLNASQRFDGFGALLK